MRYRRNPLQYRQDRMQEVIKQRLFEAQNRAGRYYVTFECDGWNITSQTDVVFLTPPQYNLIKQAVAYHPQRYEGPTLGPAYIIKQACHILVHLLHEQTGKWLNITSISNVVSERERNEFWRQQKEHHELQLPALR